MKQPWGVYHKTPKISRTCSLNEVTNREAEEEIRRELWVEISWKSVSGQRIFQSDLGLSSEHPFKINNEGTLTRGQHQQ
jgi:hypothetical protein